MVSLVEALPSDIIVDITSRLPVKSIINCTLVCKFWRTLIPNPFVVKNNPTYLLLYNEKSARYAIFDHDYDDLICIRRDQVIELKPSFPGYQKHAFEEITLFGSCNGLICFSQTLKGVTLNIYLYNPVLGESVTVPKPTLNYSIGTLRYDRYAFGFCPVTNHCKVFRSVHPIDEHDTQIEVYTLGTPQWRHIGHVPQGFGINLATEEFGLSPPPPPVGRGEEIYKLGCMDHCLVATTRSLQPDLYMDVWTRKESTWSKNWVLYYRTGTCDLRALVPVATSADGIILMIYPWGEVYHLDPKDNRATPRVVNGDYAARKWSWSGVVPYDATLVSPRELMKDVPL